MPANEAETMVCDQHETFDKRQRRQASRQRRMEAKLVEIQNEQRQQSRDLKDLTMHLIPQARNGNGSTGPQISVQATGQQQATPAPTNETYWLKITALCLVILAAGSAIWPRVAAIVGPLLR
jgi:hypothetical protein